MAIRDAIKRAWNAFSQEDSGVVPPTSLGTPTYGGSNPSQYVSRGITNERTIIASIYNRIGIDVADVVIRHIKNNDRMQYEKDVSSSLQACLTFSPNLDQGPRQFRQDIVATMFDEGVAAIVPIDVVDNPNTDDVFDVYSLRVGRVVQWFPSHVRVECYNEKSGKREEVTLNKDYVALVENPFYAVMNQTNSTLQRLVQKLTLLDTVDKASSSGKLDIIIQLPYVVKSEAKRLQAEQRRQDMESQLEGSKYGVAYADGTEKITQLNRPAENNLLAQVQYLTDMLYSQLGLTPEVMNGTADEQAMINYRHRTIIPIADAIVQAMSASFISGVAVGRGERIDYFVDPFQYVPMEHLAEIADKFSRNEILSPNEIRGFMGIPPSDNPKANELNNSNMPPIEATATESPVA